MRAVPIPGEILRTDVFLGLTFNELITLGSAPIVLVFPSLFIKQIPLAVSLGLCVLFAIGVVGVVLQTPEGQTPLEWGPMAAKRRLRPDTYYLKPRHRKRDELRHIDVVQTAEQIHAESLPDPEQSESAATDDSTDVDATETRTDRLPDLGHAVVPDTLSAETDAEEASDGDGDDQSTRVPLVH